MRIDFKWALIEIAKKINKIEKTDPDFEHNKKWIKLRNQQEEIYCMIRSHNEDVRNKEMGR